MCRFLNESQLTNGASELGRRVAWLALVCFCGLGSGWAQVHHESLKVLLSLEQGTSPGSMTVSVRILNSSSRVVNLAVPGGLDCEGIPGTVALEWTYKGDEATAWRTVQGIRMTCAGGNVQTVARRVTWMHFRPGEYAEVRGSINTSELIAGEYKIKAVYRTPHYSFEEKSDLRYAGVETPSGDYKAVPVSLSVGAEQ